MATRRRVAWERDSTDEVGDVAVLGRGQENSMTKPVKMLSLVLGCPVLWLGVVRSGEELAAAPVAPGL